jgi:hypothetical protein
MANIMWLKNEVAKKKDPKTANNWVANKNLPKMAKNFVG